VRNVLSRDSSGYLQATATDETELIDCGLVFRSVGYRGLALPGLPFDERRGVLPNDQGRLIDPASSAPIPGLYTSGWIKRGPSGIIGTNKPDAVETVRSMVEDLKAGRLVTPEPASRAVLETTLRERHVRFVTYPEWQKLDALEIERGKAVGRPRVKFAARQQIFAALGDEGGA
jgi:ferredoxin--NADP+ reductase